MTNEELQKQYADQGIIFEDGGKDFQSEDQSDKMITFVIDNNGADAVERVIALNPGDSYTSAELTTLLGFTVDGVFKDGEIVSEVGKVVTGSCMPGKAISMLRSFRRHPRRFTGVSFKVDNVDQLSQPLQVYDDDPTSGTPKLLTEIQPAGHESENQTNDKLISLPINHLQFDADSIVLVKVVPKAKLTLRLNPGASVNSAEMLDRAAKAEFAQKGLVRKRLKA